MKFFFAHRKKNNEIYFEQKHDAHLKFTRSFLDDSRPILFHAHPDCSTALLRRFRGIMSKEHAPHICTCARRENLHQILSNLHLDRIFLFHNCYNATLHIYCKKKEIKSCAYIDVLRLMNIWKAYNCSLTSKWESVKAKTNVVECANGRVSSLMHAAGWRVWLWTGITAGESA